MSVANRDPVSFALNARRQLTDQLRSLAIFSVSRSSALLHYFAVLEAESFKASVFSQCSPLAIFGAHRKAVESKVPSECTQPSVNCPLLSGRGTQ